MRGQCMCICKQQHSLKLHLVLFKISTLDFQVMCCYELLLHLLSTLLVLGICKVQTCCTVPVSQPVSQLVAVRTLLHSVSRAANGRTSCSHRMELHMAQATLAQQTMPVPTGAKHRSSLEVTSVCGVCCSNNKYQSLAQASSKPANHCSRLSLSVHGLWRHSTAS